jgi:ankyrin repeat protein
MRLVGILCLLPAVVGAAEPTSREWYQAIRANDVAAMKSMAASKSAVNVTDSRCTTPMMQAAAIGSLQAVKLLIDAGADVNARNGLDLTPLIYGAFETEKVKLLVAAGADVNAKSKAGRTPLIAAATRPNAAESVRLLLSKGADSNATEPTGSNALTQAARSNDLESVRLLVGKTKDVNAGDVFGFTALVHATAHGNAAMVKLLLEKGANPNTTFDHPLMVRNGPIALTKITPLMMAPLSTPECIQLLLDAHADVNARDGRGMTALMFAAASDEPNLAIMRMLLKAGADPEVKSGINEGAREWAAKFNDPEVMKLLGARPAASGAAAVLPTAGEKNDARAAIGKSVSLLQATSTEYFKQSGCVGCHHQPLIGLAVERAAKNGVAINEAERKAQTAVVKAENQSGRDMVLQGIFISVDAMAHAMQHFNEAAYPADEITDSLVSAIASQQRADGAWYGVPVVRPPMEYSTVTRTALSAMALARYPIPARRAEFVERVARARRWLSDAKPNLEYERSYQLLGLVWSGAGSSDIERVAAEVRKLQREDGGWGQTKYLKSDAFATALALNALQSAGVSSQDARVRRGVDYLLRTQLPDGSWHVASRAPKLQPYFQSGFPHDHDQWISAAATGWAVAALSNALPVVRSVAAAQ